jgi:hypothetical protein
MSGDDEVGERNCTGDERPVALQLSAAHQLQLEQREIAA